MFDIGQAAAEDREAIATVVNLAFNINVSPGEILLEGTLCAYDNSRVVGTARSLAFDQWFGGAKVPCAGISAVTVLPEYRGRGTARALMTRLLGRQRAAGDAVSVLYPANAQLYRQLGYEYGGVRPQFRAPVADFPAGKGEVSELAGNDLADVMTCFSQFASGHNGLVESADPTQWSSRILAHKGEGTHQRTVVVPAATTSTAGAPGGSLAGYASYFLDKAGVDQGFRVTCKHFVALTPGALHALVGYFRRFENAAGEVAWYGAPGTAPLGMALTSTGFSIGSTVTRWMVRVLDVPAALEARGYLSSVSGSFVISVEDTLFPANTGPWAVEVVEGRARVAPAGTARAATAARPVPIGLFSSLYTGLATPADLVLLGALDEDDPRLALLSELFAGPVPWMPDFF
jgi:predicted acetyltransferase